MEYNWEFSRKTRCSEEDRRQCLKWVSTLVSLAKMARRNGLLSLVQQAEESPSFLLSKGLQLVVDGVKPEVVKNVLETYILTGDYRGKELLERCMVLEGITAIQKGIHPKVIKELLLAFLGEDGYHLYESQNGNNNENNLETFLKKIKNAPPAGALGGQLEHVILGLNDDSIEKFLMAIDTGDLARAMKIMGGRAQVKLFASMPEKAAHALSDALDDLRDLDDSEINEASQMVLEILSDLQRQGVIAPSNF
jgi:hypothetical protein